MAHLESLVVYDALPRTRKVLAYGFQREGLKVFASGDAGDVLSMAQTRVPQLVVVSLAQPRESNGHSEAHGLTLIGHLREEPATRELPIVALGERMAREGALRAGADEFLSRPAFIRDVLTLSRLAVALRQDGGDEGVAGLLEDYELYFLARALQVAGRSGVVELERDGRSGELHFQRGEVVAATCGRMTGVVAFNHLLLWGEAQMQLRLVSPTGEREITTPTDELLQEGARFAQEFEAIASKVGGASAVFRQEPRRAAEVRGNIPPEVLSVLKIYDGKRPLIDIVEDSPFKALDTIKVTFRLLEMGIVERVSVNGGQSPLTAQLAVRDWLLGAASPGEASTSTVTEAGRRAAEAYAEEQARRAATPAPAEELLDDTAKVRTHAAAPAAQIHDKPTGRKKPKRKPRITKPKAPAPSQTVAPPPIPAGDTDRVARVELRPSADQSAIPQMVLDGDTTEPFPRLQVEAPLPPPPQPPAPPPPKPAPPVKELHFTDVEEEFFAREAEIGKITPAESFDDLEPVEHTGPKRRWFTFGQKFSTPAPKGPKKR
jgi:CheY-like chemotaxis protein